MTSTSVVIALAASLAIAPTAFATPYTPIGATPSRVSRGDVVAFGYAYGARHQDLAKPKHSTIKKEFTYAQR